jgi:hypothetical protein
MKQRSLNHFVGVLNAVIMVVFSATVYSQGPDVDKLKEEVSSQDKKNRRSRK